MFGRNLFWRETMRPARFLIFDARIVIFVAALVFYLRLSTLIVFVVAAGVFRIVESRGYDFPNAIRKTRTMIVGPFRPARRQFYRRESVDFGFELLLQKQSAKRSKGRRRRTSRAGGGNA